MEAHRWAGECMLPGHVQRKANNRACLFYCHIYACMEINMHTCCFVSEYYISKRQLWIQLFGPLPPWLATFLKDLLCSTSTRHA